MKCLSALEVMHSSSRPYQPLPPNKRKINRMSEETETSTETENFIWCDLPTSNLIKTCFTYNLEQESMSHLIWTGYGLFLLNRNFQLNYYFKSKCIQMEILPIIVQSAAIPVFF